MRLKLACIALLGLPATAAANPYEAFIDVETEEDIYDLLASQQISEETFDTLLDLYHRGVDLNTAGRAELYSLPNLTYDDVDGILAYRKEQGFIRDPAELVAARVITDDKLLAIAAFLVVRDPFGDLSQLHGFVQVQSGFTIGDDVAPPAGLRARVVYGRNLTAGAAAVMTRLQPGEVRYDPNRDALLADAPGLDLHLPKVYVAYESDDFVAIGGTFRVGFGQRLTFDNSASYTPNGIYRDDQIFRSNSLSRSCREGTGELEGSPCSDDFHYVTSDLSWREGLFGVGGGAKKLTVGDGWMQLYAWASFQTHGIYQYELQDASQCEDPRADGDPACAAPDVFIEQPGGRLTPAPELLYSTLPGMFGEALVGANASYFLSRRNYVGVTGYGATTSWFVDDGRTGGDDHLDLDFQEWSQRPMGGGFGAVGLAAAGGAGRFDVAAEAAHSFDSMSNGAGPADGGGGPAAIVRATWTEPRKHEIELSARYYDIDYLNPHARPIAAPDEFEGQRARDELGGRLKLTGTFGSLGLRSAIDVWTNPSDDNTQGEAYVRADVRASKKIGYGAWLDVTDRDLTAGGRGACYEQPYEFDELGEPIDCAGMRVAATGRLRVQLDRRTSLSGQLQGELLDDPDYPDGFRRDVSAWAIATHKPRDDLRLRLRIRYLSEDIAASDRLEESLWLYGEGTLRLRKKDRLRVRLDTYVWLDDRDRTALREPSPEIRLWAMYDARF